MSELFRDDLRLLAMDTVQVRATTTRRWRLKASPRRRMSPRTTEQSGSGRTGARDGVGTFAISLESVDRFEW
jgi:hypothetical protein